MKRNELYPGKSFQYAEVLILTRAFTLSNEYLSSERDYLTTLSVRQPSADDMFEFVDTICQKLQFLVKTNVSFS